MNIYLQTLKFNIKLPYAIPKARLLNINKINMVKATTWGWLLDYMTCSWTATNVDWSLIGMSWVWISEPTVGYVKPQKAVI